MTHFTEFSDRLPKTNSALGVCASSQKTNVPAPKNEFCCRHFAYKLAVLGWVAGWLWGMCQLQKTNSAAGTLLTNWLFPNIACLHATELPNGDENKRDASKARTRQLRSSSDVSCRRYALRRPVVIHRGGARYVPSPSSTGILCVSR